MTTNSAASHHERLSALRARLMSALRDGVFTDAELSQAREDRVQLGLDVTSARALKAEVFHAYHERACADRQFSQNELDSMNRLLQFFNDFEVPQRAEK